MVALIRKIPIEPKIDFLSKRRLFLLFSACLMVLSLGSFFVQGLNFGVDFRGDILIEIRTDGPADLGDLRSRLCGLGLGQVTLQEFGEPTDVLIRIERQAGDEREQLKAVEVVKAALGAGVDYRRVETPRLAKDMAPQDITVTQDDTFTGGLCLVGMEPVSNFIILERLAAARDQTTWNELIS